MSVPLLPRRLHLSFMLTAAFGAADASAQQTTTDDPVPTITAVRLDAADQLVLDGSLDEPFWQRAPPANRFVQREPATGAPATEQTDVRIVYDERRLVLGVTLADTNPDAVLANQMQRDASFNADDSFAWVFDTFLDGRTGYFFEINPAGAMGDGLISPGGAGGRGRGGGGGGGGGNNDINRSWDGIWTARVRRTDNGWAAEIEIPFRTLNFDQRSPVWGINFQRTVRRKNEDALWSGHALNQGLTRLVNAGRLEGIRDVSQGLGLDLKPYAVGHVSTAPGLDQPDAEGDGDVGLDAFYNITPSLGLNVSVNTDFAETEVDERRVNLTRFPLFFEEKRDFFLEGSSYFDFGRMPGQAVMPFFSRQIGRDEQGQSQRIDVGAKLTGRAGAFDVGVLQVRTGADDEAEQIGEDFSVVRVRRRMFEQSYVGALYTRRAGRVAGDDARHTAGLDVALNTSRFRGDKNLELNAFYLWTSDPLAPADGSAGFGGQLSYPNDPWTASIAALELQPGYNPAVGFVERRGYRQVSPSFEWAPRLNDHAWIRGLEFSVEGDFQTDMHNDLLTREVEVTALQVNTHDGGRFQFMFTPQYERLEEDFEISDGVVLPAGAVYRFTRYQLEAQTADHRMVSIAPEFQWGDFFSGRRRDISLRLDVRPRRGLALSLEAERNLLDLAEGSFTADVYRLTGNTQFSPWISLANNLQYDTVSRLLGWQVRFRWIQRPGNDLFVVYTHNWTDVPGLPDRRRFTTLDNRLATKLVYTLRF